MNEIIEEILINWGGAILGVISGAFVIWFVFLREKKQ